MDFFSILIGLAIVLASLTVHEAAHAWTADRLGDPTARLLGRVSLNPIVHIDPIGTILLPLISAYTGMIIGWAKPVPVNLSQLRHPRRDFMIVAAAGPISNILQAIAAAIVFRFVALAAGGDSETTAIVAYVLQRAVAINLLLAFFNLIPSPPLDGGNVLAGLVPERAAAVLDTVRQFGFILLYALMFTGILNSLIIPPTRFFLGVLLP